MLGNLLKKNTFIVGFISIIFAALLWSIDGLFLRTKLYEIPAEIVIFWEHFFGFIILLPFLIKGFPKLKYLSKKDWGSIMWISLVGSVMGTLFITKAFFMAFELGLSISIIVILQKLQPISALFLARILLGEKLSKRFYFWASISIISAFFLVFSMENINFSFNHLLSNPALYAIIAALAFGSSTVFGKHLINHIDHKTTTAIRFTIGTIFSLILVIIFSKVGSLGNLSFDNWKYLIIIAFTTGTSALFIYYYGLKKVSASAATIAELFFPFFTIILEYLFFHKFLSLSQIVFTVIFLIAILMTTKKSKLDYIFSSHWIKGSGRGTKMGLRTINLAKKELEINFGVYLVVIYINEKKYYGLMHYGPILTFQENVGVEIYLQENIISVEEVHIKVHVINKIRSIRKFKNKEKLVKQIKKDILVLEKRKEK